MPAAAGRLSELVAEYDGPDELARGPLLDEMERLDGAAAAHELARAGDAAARRTAARLMHLLPSAGHVAPLERLTHDPDGAVAATALAALHDQPRTAEWHEAVQRLAQTSDDARAWLQERARG